MSEEIYTPEEQAQLRDKALMHSQLGEIANKVAEVTAAGADGLWIADQDAFAKLLLNYHNQLNIVFERIESFVMPHVLGGDPVFTNLLTSAPLYDQALTDFLASLELAPMTDEQIALIQARHNEVQDSQPEIVEG